MDASGRSVITDRVRWPDVAPALARIAIERNEPRRGRLPATAVQFELPAGQSAEAIAIPADGLDGRRVALLVVTNDAFVQRQIALINRVLVGGALIGLVGSLVSGWCIAGIAVEPIRRLAGLADQFALENIDREFVVEDQDAEVAALTSELNAARVRIREAFAAQERFLSNVSHELKTPIAVLLTEAQTLNREGVSRELDEFVTNIEEQMRKLGRLVESFLTLTRVRDGGAAARSQSYLANELVLDSVGDCAAMAAAYGVSISPRLAEGESALDAGILGDPDLLRTMLNNVIRNALRFSPRGAVVSVDASVEDDAAFVIAVTDRGPGIPEDLLDHVFDRFAQGTTEARRERGHGLGLAIAKGVAELHGGDISAANESTGGARFAIRLPIARGLIVQQNTPRDLDPQHEA